MSAYGAAVPLTVIAHRGASGTRPENTLVAFRRAFELGAHMIELDVQPTRDGAVVVMHDDTLERTTNGRGRVTTHRLTDLQTLDAGTWFAPAYAGERIPTRGEVLTAVPIPINVELKPGKDPGFEERALEVVAAAGALDRIVFSSFDAESLLRLRAASAEAAIAVLWYRRRLAAALHLAGRAGAIALHLRKDAVSPAGVREATAAGLEVRAWTVNDPADSAALEAAGVRGVFTDFPERFLHT